MSIWVDKQVCMQLTVLAVKYRHYRLSRLTESCMGKLKEGSLPTAEGQYSIVSFWHC